MSEEQTFRREVAVTVAEGDGRTLEARLIRYGESATVADPPDFQPYQERFAAGAFRAQTRAAHRIRAFLNFRHAQDIGNQIGYAQEIEDREDGLYGKLRVLETPAGDTALALVNAGVLDKLSIEFRSMRERVVAGVVERLDARLLGVALTPEGAYSGAEVLAVREAPEPHGLEPLPPIPAELVDSLRGLKVRLPDDLTEQPLERQMFTEMAWDGSSARWDTPEAYCSSALIDLNPAGQQKTKAACYLPVREPGSGDVNVNAVRAALGRIGQGFPLDASQADRDRARAKALRLLAQFNNPTA